MQEKFLLKVEQNLVIKLTNLLSKLMAHEFELSHDGTIVEACNSEVSHEFLGDLTRDRKGFERRIEKLLVSFSSLSIDVIEKFHCVSLRVNEHAVMQYVNDRGTFSDLNPCERNRLHYRHNVLIISFRISFSRFQSRCFTG